MSNKMKALVIAISIIFIAFIIVFSYLFFNGLSGLYIRNAPTETQIKVACVGDSITYGHGVNSWHNNNYPAVLQKLLGEEYNVQNFGVSGATAQHSGDKPYIYTKSYQPSIDYKADVLVFMLGSNDSKPYNWNDKESFKMQYIELLDKYLVNNSPKVYLCTVSQVFYIDKNQTTGPSTYDIQRDKVDIINDVIKEVADEKGLNLIDIYSVTKEQPEWFKDNIHPEANGAKAIAEEIHNNIK